MTKQYKAGDVVRVILTDSEAKALTNGGMVCVGADDTVDDECDSPATAPIGGMCSGEWGSRTITKPPRDLLGEAEKYLNEAFALVDYPIEDRTLQVAELIIQYLREKEQA